MIEVDNFWHLKTFEAVLTDLQRRWDEVIHEQKDMSIHCTENSEKNDEMDGIEVIDLCSKTQTKTSEIHDGEESTKQESQDKMKSKTIARLESKNRPEKDNQMAESEENELPLCNKTTIRQFLWVPFHLVPPILMMCWEHLEDSPGKEPREESENKGKKSVKEMQKPKDEEEHVNSTLHMGNQLKISIDEFSWETERRRINTRHTRNRTTTVSLHHQS